MFRLLICASSWWYHLSSRLSREWKSIGLFGKINSVSFIYRRFIHDAMEHWIVLWQGHLIFVIFTISFASITAVRLSHGKFVNGLADILFMVYHTSHCASAAVGACQVWFSGKFLFFVFICEKHGTMDLLYFLWQPQAAQPLQGLGIPLICFCMLFKARRLLSVSLCLIVVDRL